MKYLLTIVAAMASGLAATQIYASDYDFQPGLWETVTTVDTTGVPADMAAMMKVAPQKEQECVKENDILFPSNDECKYDKKRVSANKLLVNIACTSPEGITKGKGEINFNGKKVTGWFEMDISQGQSGPMKIKNTFNAKYIGSCK